MGESCDSGFSPALDAMAKDGKSAPFSNDSQASLDPWSYSTLRLIPGDTFSKNDSSVVVMEGAFVAGPSLLQFRKMGPSIFVHGDGPTPSEGQAFSKRFSPTASNSPLLPPPPPSPPHTPPCL